MVAIFDSVIKFLFEFLAMQLCQFFWCDFLVERLSNPSGQGTECPVLTADLSRGSTIRSGCEQRFDLFLRLKKRLVSLTLIGPTVID